MPFQLPTLEDIRARILQDIQNLQSDADVSADSDYYIRATATAAAIEGLYQHQAWVVRQMLPDTSDADFLERWCSLYGIKRLPAAKATGSIAFTGEPAAPIPSGTLAKTAGGVVYATTAAAVVGGGGSVTVAAQAQVAGAAGNAPVDTALTLTTAPPGVDSVSAVVAMTGGADQESLAALLARLLDRIQDPPQGGSRGDYRRWAKDVPGVADAWIYPKRWAANSIDVVIMAVGGFPSPELIDSVTAVIETNRNPCADCLVMAPVAVPVAVTAALTLSGTSLPVATSAIEAALETYFAGLEPGDTVYRNRIAALIADVEGVVDFNLTAPAANVVALVDDTHTELATLGVVTLT